MCQTFIKEPRGLAPAKARDPGYPIYIYIFQISGSLSAARTGRGTVVPLHKTEVPRTSGVQLHSIPDVAHMQNSFQLGLAADA